MAGVDVMMASRRGGTGFDYYTLTYDDPDEQYEEDSIPGMGSGGSGSPSAMAYGFSGHKLPPGFNSFFTKAKLGCRFGIGWKLEFI